MPLFRKILIVAFVLIPFVVNHATPDDYDFSLDQDMPAAGSLAANHGPHLVFSAAVAAIMSSNPALESLITPAVRALVRRRYATSVALVREDSELSEKERCEVKTALLVVAEMNPHQEFYPAEHALIKGVSLQTLRKKGDQRSTKPLGV
jgi:hypothetical protein